MVRTFFDKLGFAVMLAVIVFSTLLFGAVNQSILAATYLLIALMVVLWATDSLVSRRLKLPAWELLIPLGGAAVYGFIQVIPFGRSETSGVAGIANTISIDPFATLVSALHFAMLALFLALALVHLDSAKRLRLAANFITGFGFIFAFFAILQYVLSPSAIYGFYERSGAPPFGSFVSRNNFAAWIEIAAVFPLALVITRSVTADKRLLYLTASLVMGVALILSGSRGGLVALIVQIAFLSLITLRSRSQNAFVLRIALVTGLLVTVIAGSIFVGGESSLTRLTEKQSAAATDVTRIHMWKVSTKIIADSMPLGVGLGAFGPAYTRFDEASGFHRVEQAHNDYLQTLTDAGIPGAILGALFLFLVIRLGLRAIKIQNNMRRAIACAALTGIVGVLVHSLFDFVLHTPAIALLFLLALALLRACASDFDDDVPDENHF